MTEPQERYPALSPRHRSQPTAWIDAAEDDALVGWLYWPVDSAHPGEIDASLNGRKVPMALELGGRPDVPAQLGIAGPVHAFRVGVDLSGTRCDEPFELVLSARDVTLDVWSGTAGELLAQLLSRVWAGGPPARVVRALHTGFGCAKPPPGRSNGAIASHGAAGLPAPTEFFDDLRPIGPRVDLAVSAFQHFAYFRHVREHPAFRTDRHLPVTTRAGLVSYLVWSLRMFAITYPFAPLPFGSGEAAALNAPLPDTGLAKGRSAAAMASRLCLTAAQEQFIRERYNRVATKDPSEYGDWLAAWLGSWGWGYKGWRLLTHEQAEFMTGPVGDPCEPGTIGAISQLNRHIRAQLHSHPDLIQAYPDRHLVHVRLALMCDLAAAEVTESGSDALMPREFISWVTRRSTISSLVADALPSSDAPAITIVPPATDRPEIAVRVIGMLQSKSGLGQNARLSVEAVRFAGIDCDDFPLAINDATAGTTPHLLSSDRARVNIWHLNPDNLPEAVCTLDPAMYDASYNIGFFAWELDRQPTCHQLALDWVDEIWVPSAYCAATFRTATDKPIVVMPHAIEVPQLLQPFPRDRLGVPNDAFLVHCSFDLNSWPARKNPLGVIAAFQRAYDDDGARLLLKIRHGTTIGYSGADPELICEAVLELAEADDRILIDIQERSYSDTLALIAASDCHISLHRSEGFGYSLAEAMALGVPLICTDYSGSRDFCTEDNAWLVPASERYVEPAEYWLAPAGAKWGEPDLDVAVDQLRRVRAGGEEVQSKTAAARRCAAELSMAQMSRRYRSRLGELLDGERLPTR